MGTLRTALRSPALAFFVIVLPLVFAAYGGWQVARASPDAARIASIDRGMAEIRQLQHGADAGETVMLRLPDGGLIPASAALARLESLKEDVGRTAYYTATFCKPLAAAVMLFGLCAALAGAAGLIGIRRAAREALLSREALSARFPPGLQRLPRIIAAVGALLAAALACAAAYELVTFASSGIRGRGSAPLIALGLAAVGVLVFSAAKLVWSMYATSTTLCECGTLRITGKSVSREEAPKVWDFVRSIAARARTRMPDAIILGLDQGFFVTEHPVELADGAPPPSGRVLYLPLPFMAFMTGPEAEAVIGHELAHVTGADAACGPHVWPVYASAANSLEAVRAASDGPSASVAAAPALLLAEYYLHAFAPAMRHWSREREFAADRVGAAIAGGETLALALLRLSLLAPRVALALDEVRSGSGRLKSGILAHIRERVRENDVDDPAARVEEARPGPMAGHPGVGQRLAALGVALTPERIAGALRIRESTLLRDLGIIGNDGYREDAETARATRAETALSATPSLPAALEEVFASLAGDNAVETGETLRALAAGGRETIAFYEGMAATVRYACLAVAGLVVGAVGVSEKIPALMGAGTTLAVLLGLAALYCNKRRKRPLATLAANGILMAGLAEKIPWEAVDDCWLTVHSRTAGGAVTAEFLLAPGYDPPEIHGDRRTRYRPETHALRLEVRSIARPHSAARFGEAVLDHCRGGRARHALREAAREGEILSKPSCEEGPADP